MEAAGEAVPWGGLMEEETERGEAVGLSQPVALSLLEPGPRLSNPCPMLGDPRLPGCSFSQTGETSSGERTNTV